MRIILLSIMSWKCEFVSSSVKMYTSYICDVTLLLSLCIYVNKLKIVKFCIDFIFYSVIV